MKKMILPLLIISLVFGSVPLLRADSGSAGQRDITVDNAIGGMREGSRIVPPDAYAEKAQTSKAPGAQIHPVMDARSAAAGSGADTAAKSGVFTEGASPGVSAGVSEGIAGSGGPGAETPSGINAGGLGGGASIEIEAPSGIGAGSLTGGTDPAGGSGAEVDAGLGAGGAGESTAGGSLIDIDASADLSSGSVEANVGLDTDNTDQILDADLSAGAGETGSLAGGADITAEDITADSALPPEITDSAISSEADIGTEVDTSGGAVGGEADIGIEADVEGGSEGDDLANDPADGLPGL
jgi:hypothetical protein